MWEIISKLLTSVDTTKLVSAILLGIWWLLLLCGLVWGLIKSSPSQRLSILLTLVFFGSVITYPDWPSYIGFAIAAVFLVAVIGHHIFVAAQQIAETMDRRWKLKKLGQHFKESVSHKELGPK